MNDVESQKEPRLMESRNPRKRDKKRRRQNWNLKTRQSRLKFLLSKLLPTKDSSLSISNHVPFLLLWKGY
jgi:hypothetical protein